MTEIIFDESDYEYLQKCPWCNSSRAKQWGKDVEPFNTVECEDCGLVYVNSRLSSRGRDKYYYSYYSKEHQAVPAAKVRNKMYKLEFDYIHDHLRNGKILDVGCSGGEFLNYFEESGFDCYGVEVCREAAEVAQKRWGDKIINAALCDSEVKGPFDLVVMRGTIEHIPDAKETLVKAVDLLNKNRSAFIYITSTPNVDSVSAKIFKTSWTQHLPEEHLYHFKKKHFDDLFGGFGMYCIASHYFYEETPYANVEEDILSVAEAIKRNRNNETIDYKSPPFYGNMMSLIYHRGAD